MRNIAIYGDKIIAATTDARLVALSAINGKKRWDITIADRTKGCRNTSGPIVAKGRSFRAFRAARVTAPTAASSAPDDANTGAQPGSSTPWRTIGEPGGDTWVNFGDNFRQGGETWIAATTPDLNPTY